ncbi:MAG: hypothetical protein KKE02_04155 [Alphaproteobacteria bacterium]|nr:hypothetical protein [Alphaproteobacteria bacterium]MBU1513615.1 hypothetical protein [Alphaproteobacteria bacterium]MBU2094740.1 hypothetical protein [Alphaproteobacteria bacterium]MBU2150191.1 hypothetical protein [Alphaproteobacteria bacterium]MBU2309280.1 hypothetical protein [Alphaproteobacteria bacterium]
MYDLPKSPTIEDLSEATMLGLFSQAVGAGDTQGAETIWVAMQAELKRRSIRPSARSRY